MLNFVENLLENERDPRSGPMNDQDHSLSLSDPDRSLVLSHFLTNFLQNLASCHTALIVICVSRLRNRVLTYREKNCCRGRLRPRQHNLEDVTGFRRQGAHNIFYVIENL
jgi:hypothetical protein